MTFSVSIPRRKADMERRYDRHEWLPAINVKYYKPPEYMADRIAKHFGCDDATAQRAAEWCYESAVEQFWEQALDSLNFAMLGDENASKFKPCGLNEGPYSVERDGRTGGWLIAKGIGTIEEMSGPTFQKWRKFCRFIDGEMKYLASWDYGKSMIEANDWCPKADSVAAAAENVRTGDTRKLAEVARAVHECLNGKEWSADTHEAVADCFDRAGFRVANYEAG